MTLGAVVLSAYLNPRPDRFAAGRHLAHQLALDFPTMMEIQPNPVSVSSRRAWATLLNGRTGGLTHGLVIQDDVQLTPGFSANVQRAIEANPAEVLTLFFIRGKIAREAASQHRHWVRTQGGVSAQAIVAPLSVAEEFLRWEQDYVTRDYPHDDGRWSLWAYFTKRYLWATVPSLVTHDLSLKSSLGHAGRMNVASIVADGKPIDWSLGLTEPMTDKALGWGPASQAQIGRIKMMEPYR